MKFLPILYLLLVGGSSCQSRQAESPQEGVMKLAAPAQPEQDALQETEPVAVPIEPTQTVPVSTNRKIIRNATLRFRVDNLSESGKRINALVKQSGSLISSSEDTRSEGQIQTTLTVRVSAEKLDSFVETMLKESIYTDIKTITAEDITRQYVDTEARIRSKKATEEKYLQILKQAKNVKEVLEVEAQLRQMREEIEVQEAELREMKNNVALSTVNATYYQEIENSRNPEAPFYVQIIHNLRDGFGVVGDFLVGIFYFLPLLLVTVLPVWLVVRWWRRRKQLKIKP